MLPNFPIFLLKLKPYDKCVRLEHIGLYITSNALERSNPYLHNKGNTFHPLRQLAVRLIK